MRLTVLVLALKISSPAVAKVGSVFFLSLATLFDERNGGEILEEPTQQYYLLHLLEPTDA